MLAIWVMNLYEQGKKDSGDGATQADPVTCAQLTRLFDHLIVAIGEMKIPVPPAPPPPPPPPLIDLSAIDADLKNLQTTLAAFAKCVCDAMSGGVSIAPDLQVKWVALVQSDVEAGLINAADAQTLLS